MSTPRRPFQPPLRAARDLAQLVRSTAAAAASRRVQNLLRRGTHGRAIDTGPDQTVLLFFEDLERDTVMPNDRYVRRALRRAYHATTVGRRASGFEVAFRLLCRSLETAGCRVVVNNRQLAARHPEHPVGLCGYPHIVDDWRLPNPAVLGPGLFDHPSQAPRLMDDPRFRSYIVPCEWMRALFADVYGNHRCFVWFAGMDVEQWPDVRDLAKDIDLLVYEKILWRRPETIPAVLDPVMAELRRRGLRAEIIRYGHYQPGDYAALLARSRGMVFLCEHETQGIAYQEALARNVPVLAWDQGWWLDPARERYSITPVPASSVPYFSPACGERFVSVGDFPGALDLFLARLPRYEPRRFVGEQLSLHRSAQAYLDAYTAAAG